MITHSDDGHDLKLTLSDPTKAVSVEWNKKKLRQFKREFAKAVQKQMAAEGTFKFEGQTFPISYASYLIEFLDQKLLKKSKS